MTYLGLLPSKSVARLDVDDGGSVADGGSVEGRVLYVYGRVVAVGRETNGETVRGTWTSTGCGSGSIRFIMTE